MIALSIFNQPHLPVWHYLGPEYCLAQEQKTHPAEVKPTYVVQLFRSFEVSNVRAQMLKVVPL